MSASTPGLVLSGDPRAQLLPPSVKEREKNRAARRLMGLLVVLAVVIAGASTGAGILLVSQAEARLADAQQRTLDLLAQQAEYAEGARVAGLVVATEQARTMVTANEIDWLALTTSVLGYFPCDCVNSEITFTGPAAWEPSLLPEGPLRPERVATMTITLSSATYVDGALFVTGLRTMEGVADAVITDTSLETGVYRTSVSITFDASVLALRYAAAAPEPGADAADDDATQASAEGAGR